MNNVVITMNPNGYSYNFEEDISIRIKDEYIIREYTINECPLFNFYESDSEETYQLYGNDGENNDENIIVREYPDYFTFEIITSNIDLKI